MAHITGGGITENLPRVLPKGMRRHCRNQLLAGAAASSSTCRAIGNVPQDEMLRTFNMGIGMILVVPAKKFKKVQTILERCGEKGYTIGRIVKGEKKVTYQ